MGYQSAKVWTVDGGSKIRPRGPRPRLQKHVESKGRRPADAKRRAVRSARRSVWARLAVVGVLSTAILWWPYGRTCGYGLASYLAASSMIVVGGLWVVACTWIVRMPRTHALAMLVTLWGVGLIGVEVLPRVGYAKPAPGHPATWWCTGPSPLAAP